MPDYSKDFQVAYDGARDSCTIRFRCFDTPNSVTAFGVSQGAFDAERVLLDVRRECLELHGLWSFSCEDSDISRVNGPVERMRVDVRTAMLVAAMKAFHDREPSFDFTIGPASFFWKRATRVPEDSELSEVLAHVGAEKVTLEGDVLVKADPLVQVDVGGAAKGFAADAAAAIMRRAGVRGADIDLGGNLYMVGAHPEGRPWRVAIRVPEGIEASGPVAEVVDQSVVTSGSYERFVEIDGKRYQHIVDAATGRPSESDFVSATVVAASSLQADMLATTALMAGTKGIDALKARHPEAAFIAITGTGRVIR